MLDQFYDITAPTLTTIVPSYQEDAQVIRNTLLSAALQEYPSKRIVLLIDDPPTPRTEKARDQLRAARALPGELEHLLAAPASRFTRALHDFEAEFGSGARPGFPVMVGPDPELRRRGELAARTWPSSRRSPTTPTPSSPTRWCSGCPSRLRAVALALRESLAEDVVLEPVPAAPPVPPADPGSFRAELTSFERKQYVSLSHEPNKAMNLNSYIGLMGGSYR